MSRYTAVNNNAVEFVPNGYPVSEKGREEGEGSRRWVSWGMESWQEGGCRREEGGKKEEEGRVVAYIFWSHLRSEEGVRALLYILSDGLLSDSCTPLPSLYLLLILFPSLALRSASLSTSNS
jgi:hypothetical protein